MYYFKLPTELRRDYCIAYATAYIWEPVFEAKRTRKLLFLRNEDFHLVNPEVGQVWINTRISVAWSLMLDTGCCHMLLLQKQWITVPICAVHRVIGREPREFSFCL